MSTTTNQSILEHPLGEGGRFSLKLPTGDVRIRAIDGGTARVRDLDGDDLAERFRIEQSDGNLALHSPEKYGFDIAIGLGFGRKLRPVRLEVELPRGTTIAVDTASADVRVDGIRAPGRYRSASGDLTLAGVSGDLDLQSVSGEIEVRSDDTLGLAIRTVSGDVDVRAASVRQLAITTTSGDLRLDAPLPGPGPYAANSVSGDIAIVAYAGIQVDARTITGEIRSEVPGRSEHDHGRRTLVIGDGHALITFKSVSGDLRLTRPRTAAPVAPAAPAAPIAVLPPAAPTAPATAAIPAAVAPAAAQSVVPGSSSDTGAADAATPRSTPSSMRLDILRALERGELTVDAASAGLAEIEEDEA